MGRNGKPGRRGELQLRGALRCVASRGESLAPCGPAVLRDSLTDALESLEKRLGTTLGSYAVTAKIGEGGMGEVYRATDTKLNRQVALKILPEAFAADADRLALFQREELA